VVLTVRYKSVMAMIPVVKRLPVTIQQITLPALFLFHSTRYSSISRQKTEWINLKLPGFATKVSIDFIKKILHQNVDLLEEPKWPSRYIRKFIISKLQ
jgi:hypothetical protein